MSRVDEALNILQMSDVERKIYERQIQNTVIYKSELDAAERKGQRKGQIGILLDLGMNENEIAQKLKLSIIEVRRIIKDLHGDPS